MFAQLSPRRTSILLAAGALLMGSCATSSPDVAVEQRVTAPTTEEPAAPATDPEPPTTDTAPPATEPDAPTTDAPVTTVADPEVEEPVTEADTDPAADLVFTECRQLECATIAAPIDPDQPELGTVDIAINVVRSADPDARQGYLLINPGGPGGSGKQFAEVASFFFPPEILAAFDIVGFDPRGVGDSEPTLTCGGRDVLRAQTDQVTGAVDTPDEITAMETAVEVCSEATGPAAPYLGTEFVAHDMDAIRTALGVDQISFYGASYGSTVGTWFATLYPQSVRAMVVDGADNPVDELDTPELRIESLLEEIRAFEDLLGEALESCDSAACPIFNDGDPIAYYREAMAKIELVNEARPNLDDAGFFGVVSTLYSEGTWPSLHEGLFELQENDDPSILASSSDLQASPSDIREIEWINCLDNWSLFPQIDRDIQLGEAEAADAAFESEFPLLAASSTQEDAMSICPFLDTIAPEPLDIPLDGGDVAILVIGNPSDPATPFTESLELVEETLSNGYLLEADNPEHVVFGRGNDCVDAIVIDVLVNLEFPERRAECARR